MNKGLLILLLTLVIGTHFVSASIAIDIKFQDTLSIKTQDSNISITFTQADFESEKMYLRVNENNISLVLFQKRQFNGFAITLDSISGTDYKNLVLHISIDGTTPFFCLEKCEDSILTDLIQPFYNDFKICKKDCTKGCGLYKYTTCRGNSTWEYDNCDNPLREISRCEGECNAGVCTNCNNGICEDNEHYLTCNDCNKTTFDCLSSSDCVNEPYCVIGRCSYSPYIESDLFCDLPTEPCSSQDCSCDNNIVQTKITKNDYPIILLHGFASSTKKMSRLKRYLSYDLGYVDAGEIKPSDNLCKTSSPNSIFSASYYIEDSSDSNALSDFIGVSFDKARNIEKESPLSYSLSVIIDKVRACTGAQKVNIISHSMGGLVARNYASSKNARKVAKMILIGTPNEGGIYGDQTIELFSGVSARLGDRQQLLSRCSSLNTPSIVLSVVNGHSLTDDCDELQKSGLENSIFLIDPTPHSIEYYTIIGNIDGKGDGTILMNSAKLSGAQNATVNCNHFDLKDPPKCLEAYKKISEFLGYPEPKKKSIWYKLRDFFLG